MQSYIVVGRKSDTDIIHYMFMRLCKVATGGKGIKAAGDCLVGCSNGIASQFYDMQQETRIAAQVSIEVKKMRISSYRILHTDLPKKALAAISARQRSYIDEFIFYKHTTSTGAVYLAMYAGEYIATWKESSKDWETL